ncbi:MAG: response regulator transcription factor [Pseudomonadota bacterium]
MQILLIEDDAETARFIGRGLGEMGWTVVHHAEPGPALLTLSAGRFDAVILDRMLPGMDGISALTLLRGAGISVPVLMLTARAGLDDRVAGLNAGADDYLGKPFALSELAARLRSLARRPPLVAEATVIEVGELVLDRVAHAARRGDVTLELSPTEFKLLDQLMQHPGEVVTRTMLLEKVWGLTFDPKTSLVQTHMSRLRAKLDKPFARDLIQTVRGVGYVLAPS